MNIHENPSLFPRAPGLKGEASDVASAASAAAADFESFLNLLTAQLRNQDPLQPMDSTEFVAQLASFSTVEQLVGTNERLDALQAMAAASDVASLGTWIGRDVSARDGSFRALGGPVQFAAPRIAGTDGIVAKVLRSDGSEVLRFPVSPDSDGRAIWSGRDAKGNFVRNEDLRIALEYRTGETIVDERAGAVYRTVLAIRGTDDGVLLELSDGRSIPPGDVSELRDRSSEAQLVEGATT